MSWTKFNTRASPVYLVPVMFCLVFLFLKESTRKLTALHLRTGLQATRSGIVITSLCSFPTLKKGVAGLKLVESRLTLLWPGFPFSLVLRLCCLTSSIKRSSKNGEEKGGWRETVQVAA